MRFNSNIFHFAFLSLSFIFVFKGLERTKNSKERRLFINPILEQKIFMSIRKKIKKSGYLSGIPIMSYLSDFSSTVDLDRDQVDPRLFEFQRQTSLGQPVDQPTGRGFQSFYFNAVHRLFAAAEKSGHPGFDFDKNQKIVFQSEDVYFSGANFKVAGENPEIFSREVTGGDFFTERADLFFIFSHSADKQKLRMEF